MSPPAAKRRKLVPISLLEKKCFNDPIHGTIMLHPLLVKVIDTPQFQRLRNIKQLGGNYFVYPAASHNRFEHSIGTCHLAGKLARHLKSEQRDLKIEEEDVLCVELAGLCHDLGHGPFSHMFDHAFMQAADKEKKFKDYWEHEKRSCLMFDEMLKNEDLEKEFKKYFGEDLEETKTFIKEMIDSHKIDHENGWDYKGRKKEKSFLYEIISNKRNGVDVDKWDYFARDSHHLGIANSFDHVRFMTFMRVLKKRKDGNGCEIDPNDPYFQICGRDKECKNLYEMFHTRNALHRRGYQHKKSTAVEAMICDAMLLANDYILFEGKHNNLKKISETADDMVAFEKLSDNVFQQVLYWKKEVRRPGETNAMKKARKDKEDKMEKAKLLLKRINEGKLYTFIGSKKCPSHVLQDKKIFEIWKESEEEMFNECFKDVLDDVAYREKKFDFGQKKNNPVDSFLFYTKDDPEKPKQMKKEEISHILPDTFMDFELEVYCKNEEKKDEVKDLFNTWVRQ